MKTKVQTNEFYFGDGPYLQVLQGLHGALSAQETFAKLLGKARTGKSRLCGKLTQYLDRKGFRVVYFNYAIESPEMLRTMLARELDLPDSSNFERLLEAKFEEDSSKPIILIFDDAHLLTGITLLEIYRLAEVQLGTRRVLNILLCGEPALEQRLLSNSEFKALLLQVTHRFLLEPMSADALTAFLASYLEKAGLSQLIIEPAAMSYFHKSCKGYPGPAIAICQLLVNAKLGQTEFLTVNKGELARLIKASVTGPALPSSQYRDNNQWLVMGPVAVVLIIASLVFVYQQINPSLSSPETEVAVVDSSGTFQRFTAQSGVDAESNAEAMTPAAQAQSSPFAATDTEAAGPPNEDAVVAAVVATVVPAAENPDTAAGTVANNFNLPPAEPARFSLSADTEPDLEPVSDSDLVLVSAAERGVASADIVEPVYEELVGELAEESVEQIVEEPIVDDVVLESVQEFASGLPATQSQPQPVPMPDDSSAAAEIVQTEASDAAIAQIQTEPEIAETGVADIEAAEENLVALVEGESDPIEAVIVEPGIESSSDTLQGVVDNWLAAWRSQVLAAYFDSYHPDFESRYHASKAVWRSSRQRVIGGAEWIRLEMTEFQLVLQDDGTAEVQFWLSYQSSTYKDDTLKKLILADVDGRWLILEEINLDVRT